MKNEEMFGGGKDGPLTDIIDMVKGTAKSFGDLGEDVVKRLNKMTIGGAIEEFVNYYTTGQMPSVYTPQVDNKLKKIQRDGRLYCALVGDTVGELTVGDILNMGYQLSGQKEFNKLSGHIAQTGGMMYKIVTLPIYDEAAYEQQIVQLFDSFKSTINYVASIFRRRMEKNGVPSHVLADVDRIQQGLNLSLQILQYDIVVGKKKLRSTD